MAEQQKATTQTPKPKHAGGRPTKLTRELIDKAAAYVQENDTLLAGSLLPTIERLSIILDVNRDTLYEWEAIEKKTPLQQEFTDIFTRLKRVQADKLLQLSLMGRYNPVITTLLLTKHGYVKEVHQDHTTNGKDMSPVPILGGKTQENGE